MWKRERVSYAGKHYRFEHVTIEPKPAAKPRPPIWIANNARGDRELIRKTHRRVIRHADGWQTSISDPGDLAWRLGDIREQADREASLIIREAKAEAERTKGFEKVDVTFGTPPQILVNGKAAQLAPGSRIRGLDNMLVMSASLVNVKAIVNYTVDTSGLVKDVWVLRPEEVARKPWPETFQQAQSWQFDPAAQAWVKP